MAVDVNTVGNLVYRHNFPNTVLNNRNTQKFNVYVYKWARCRYNFDVTALSAVYKELIKGRCFKMPELVAYSIICYFTRTIDKINFN